MDDARVGAADTGVADAPAAQLAQLRARLEALESIEDIKRMKYRYWRACDGKDPEGFRRCFVRSGASMDYGPLGVHDDVAPVVQIYTDIAMRPDGAGGYVVRDMHHGMHPDITLLGPTEATGRWTLRIRQVDTGRGIETVTAGEYDDRYVVEDGEWKHSRCHFRALWSITRSLGPDVVVHQIHPLPPEATR